MTAAVQLARQADQFGRPAPFSRDIADRDSIDSAIAGSLWPTRARSDQAALDKTRCRASRREAERSGSGANHLGEDDEAGAGPARREDRLSVQAPALVPEIGRHVDHVAAPRRRGAQRIRGRASQRRGETNTNACASCRDGHSNAAQDRDSEAIARATARHRGHLRSSLRGRAGASSAVTIVVESSIPARFIDDEPVAGRAIAPATIPLPAPVANYATTE